MRNGALPRFVAHRGKPKMVIRPGAARRNLAAFLSGVYQKQLETVVALAFFLPVVLNLAESVSSPSVRLAMQWRLVREL